MHKESTGTALVTPDAALLWTDGRYFLQAEQELSSDWTLMRSGQPDVPTLEEWITANLPESAVLGIDASVHSVDDALALTAALDAAKRALSLRPIDNLVDAIWGGDRPPLPTRLRPPARQILPPRWQRPSPASRSLPWTWRHRAT